MKKQKVTTYTATWLIRELKNCPCCGSEARLISDFNHQGRVSGGRTARVQCTNSRCMLEGYMADDNLDETEQVAIDAWNRRIR